MNKIETNMNMKTITITNDFVCYQQGGIGKEIIIAVDELQQENKRLQKQLDYLRSGEYYNQLRFERNMLQDIVDNGEISKEDREFIDCTHRNTELLEENKQLKEKYLNAVSNYEQEKCKNNKAIEELNNNYILLPTEYADEVGIFKKKLRKILRGE